MRCLLAIFLCIAPLLMAQTPDSNSARIFITDSQSWSIAGGGGGANGAYGSTVAGGARPTDRRNHKDLRTTLPTSRDQQRTNQGRLHGFA